MEPWDAHDPRRQHDQFAPPTEPCECICHHCQRTFMSDQIWFQKINGARDGFDGYWMCPTPNCGGAGFTFDIFPTDSNHPANEGWFTFDDDEEDGEWMDEDDDDCDFVDLADDDSDGEYDPAEPGYQMLDQWAGEDDDIEGEEWKYGLEPGQRPQPTKPDWLIEEEKKYDEPDRRPREVDWTDTQRPERGGAFSDDDIPF
ncbi:MAG TPA: hypothetical protein VFE47_19150 [Tepidisphaeraceae bacterium]|jgi:hypothetical protein|nr:hypothetical protein [Tepidisphaeraceae bacterium]